jgi:hypothetical protein
MARFEGGNGGRLLQDVAELVNAFEQAGLAKASMGNSVARPSGSTSF